MTDPPFGPIVDAFVEAGRAIQSAFTTPIKALTLMVATAEIERAEQTIRWQAEIRRIPDYLADVTISRARGRYLTTTLTYPAALEAEWAITLGWWSVGWEAARADTEA